MRKFALSLLAAYLLVTLCVAQSPVNKHSFFINCPIKMRLLNFKTTKNRMSRVKNRRIHRIRPQSCLQFRSTWTWSHSTDGSRLRLPTRSRSAKCSLLSRLLFLSLALSYKRWSILLIMIWYGFIVFRDYVTV